MIAPPGRKVDWVEKRNQKLAVYLTACTFMGICVQNSGINYGYHEIIFEGVTTSYDGKTVFNIQNSESTYTPAIGDSIRIHFGATLWKFDESDPFMEGFGQWSGKTSMNGGFEIFEISVSDNLEEYLAIEMTAFDDWGGGASMDDDFYVHINWSNHRGDFGYGIISYDFNANSGYYNIDFLTPHDFFQWTAELTSARIIAAPVAEPGTLWLLGSGTVAALTTLRKRYRSLR